MKNGFDWNGNGKTDAFDRYMEMKVTQNGKKEENLPKKEEKTGNTGGKDNTLAKSLLTVLFCLGGIVLPVAAQMEGIFVALCPLAGVGLSMLIWKHL